MYNPSRGGVRGGADQFTWESVKNDKHRENYLGHSLMAPVGRWQKGKDLSWYAKERKEAGAPDKLDKSELASIKQAEEEAMLIALGHNIVRKTQTLSKEDIKEALKRNTGERDNQNMERIDGVGASSHRVALLSGVRKNSKPSTEGVAFESRREIKSAVDNKSERRNESITEDRKRSKKASKKHKKEKKHKKHRKESYDSDSSDNISRQKAKHNESETDSDSRKSSKHNTHKKSKHKHRDYSSDDSDKRHYSNSQKEDSKRHKMQNSDSSNNISRQKAKHKESESDSDSRKSSQHNTHKKSKYKHRDYSSGDSDKRHYLNSQKENSKRHKMQKDSVKRRRHDTSESD